MYIYNISFTFPNLHLILFQTSDFLPNRSPWLDGFMDVVVAQDDGDNVLTRDGLNAILTVDSYIKNVMATVTEKRSVDYDAICSRWEGSCIQHPILALYRYNASLADHVKLKFPYDNHMFIGNSLGQVSIGLL